MKDTLEHIPLFPLNIFLLPGEQLPLHIFEPRYRQLFEEAAEDQLKFGLPFEDKRLDVNMVSICRLVKVTKRYQTGELDVVIEAERLGMLKSFESVFPTKLYPGGFIENWSNEEINAIPSAALMETFKNYIRMRYGAHPNHSNVAHYRLIDIAASIAFSNEDKIRFILQHSAQRQDQLLEQNLRYLNLLLVQEQHLENGIILN